MNKLNFSKYTYKDKVKKEITETIKVYSDLLPKMELFTFNDGVQRNMIALAGTIKVFYNSQTYNIPICVYLSESHPYQPPICYVRPTSTMEIRASNQVDAQGKIYLPYLSEWIPEKSDVQGLLSILQIEFGERPPVFAKSSNSSYQPHNSYYPSYQPYPPAGGVGTGWNSFMNNVSNPTTYSGANASIRPMNPNSTPYMAGYPYQQSSNPAMTQSVNNQTSGVSGWNANGGIHDDVMRMSILSAVEDKVRRNYRDVHASVTAETEVLKNTNKELKKGTETIQKLINDMSSDMTKVESLRAELIAEHTDLSESMKQCEKEDERGIKYDESVECTAPLFKQLFSLYVEEQSIEDALYFIGESIGKKVIDIETFLKKTRELSRRQFILRATVTQCRQKAGLPDV